MSRAALRVGDPVICTCSCRKGRCPNGRVISGARTVIINNRAAAVASSVTSNCCGSCCPCPNQIIRGSSSVIFEGKPAARVSDPIRCGRTTTGSRDVFIGG